jgi:putative nucleotidyltransferase with HDIG domain
MSIDKDSSLDPFGRSQFQPQFKGVVMAQVSGQFTVQQIHPSIVPASSTGGAGAVRQSQFFGSSRNLVNELNQQGLTPRAAQTRAEKYNPGRTSIRRSARGADVHSSTGLKASTRPNWLAPDLHQTYDQFVHLVSELDEQYSRLVVSIFSDEQTLQKFLDRPASLGFHHAWRGGLFEHSVDVALECAAACERRPNLNTSLVVTAALLHDIGKIVEYEPSPWGGYRRSSIGELEMHKISGIKMISVVATEIRTAPDVLARILHCIAAAPGPDYMGLPRPKLPESNILQTSDSRSSFTAPRLRQSIPNVPRPNSRAERFSCLPQR